MPDVASRTVSMGFDAVKKATLAERMTYMKKNKTELSGGLRSSTQADAELNHIERAIGQLRAMTHKASGTLNVDYWRERLDAVRTEHALVPAQRRRVESLLKALDTLTTTPGGSTPGSRRSTNRLWAKAA
jgi:hypothetical protein